MTEATDDKVSVKIRTTTRDQLETEKMRFPRKNRPDYGQIIEAAVDAWLKKSAKERQPKYPAKDEEWHEQLQFIFDNGSPERTEWLKGNIKSFADLARLEGRITTPITARRAGGKS